MIDLDERTSADMEPSGVREHRTVTNVLASLPEPSPHSRARVAGGLVWPLYGAIVLCLIVLMLLNTRELLLTIERRPDGPIRTLLLGPMRQLEGVAGKLGLERPMALLNAVQADRDAAPKFATTPGGAAAPGPELVRTPTVTAEAAPTAEVPAATASAAAPAATVAPTPSVPPPPTATPVPSRRAITAVAPLRVYVAGDSFVDSMAEVLAEIGTKNKLLTVLPDGHPNSGLSDPSYIDWPVRMRQALANDPAPEAVVFMAGANDGVPIRTATGTFAYGTAAWNTEYMRRAGELMDVVGRSGARMYYVGQPIMRESKQNRIANDINIAISKEAASRPWVTYIDSWSLLTDANGNYSTYLVTSNGTTVKARADDGIHLTPVSTVWVADAIYAAISKEWRFAR